MLVSLTILNQVILDLLLHIFIYKINIHWGFQIIPV